ncbi:unnamed protein product [Mytilus coruscus]|uniref:Uncharacterized protein n=1 Tax=Mytilus coruscus TaxID=42192 RepID=A0A6J8AM14_MYTCO|nr:unnamed protein product [Mytilus coruscus]
MAQKERENFYRNSTVIVDHGKESLSAVLDNDLSNTNMTFEDFINTHQHDIYHLCYNKFSCCQCHGRRFVPANQSRIIYPDQLDILLDKSGQDIEDLVKYRNKLYGHVQEARLTDADYTKYKTDVEGIILRIARFCKIENEMQQKLNDASQRPLDETILMQYQNALMQQSFYDRNIDENTEREISLHKLKPTYQNTQKMTPTL